ncbi:MAG TPA: hypothetical protein VFF73_28105 [Planctomycetota bacterium]|nr:hypothetical protein [Planctomycetota bacterium]
MRDRAIFTALLFCACVTACSPKSSPGANPEPTAVAPGAGEPTKAAPFTGEPTQANQFNPTPTSGSTTTNTAVTFTPPSGSTLPPATVGSFYSQAITVSGATVSTNSLSASAMPFGLTASVGSTNTVVISGVPTQNGTFNPIIRVGLGSVDYTITVNQ